MSTVSLDAALIIDDSMATVEICSYPTPFHIVGKLSASAPNGIEDAIYNTNVSLNSKLDNAYASYTGDTFKQAMVTEIMQNVMDSFVQKCAQHVFLSSASPAITESLPHDIFPIDLLVHQEYNLAKLACVTVETSQSSDCRQVHLRSPVGFAVQVVVTPNGIVIIQHDQHMISVEKILPIGKTSKGTCNLVGAASETNDMNKFMHLYVPSAGGHGVGLKQVMLLCAKMKKEQGWRFCISGTIPSSSSFVSSSVVKYAFLEPCVNKLNIAGCKGGIRDTPPLSGNIDISAILDSTSTKNILIHELSFEPTNSSNYGDNTKVLEQLWSYVCYSHVWLRNVDKHVSVPSTLFVSTQVNKVSAVDQCAVLSDNAHSYTYINGSLQVSSFTSSPLSDESKQAARVDILIVTSNIRHYSHMERGTERIPFHSPIILLEQALLIACNQGPMLDPTCYQLIQHLLTIAIDQPKTPWAKTLFTSIHAYEIKQLALSIYLKSKHHIPAKCYLEEDVNGAKMIMKKLNVRPPSKCLITKSPSQTSETNPLLYWLSQECHTAMQTEACNSGFNFDFDGYESHTHQLSLPTQILSIKHYIKQYVFQHMPFIMLSQHQSQYAKTLCRMVLFIERYANKIHHKLPNNLKINIAVIDDMDKDTKNYLCGYNTCDTAICYPLSTFTPKKENEDEEREIEDVAENENETENDVQMNNSNISSSSSTTITSKKRKRSSSSSSHLQKITLQYLSTFTERPTFIMFHSSVMEDMLEYEEHGEVRILSNAFQTIICDTIQRYCVANFSYADIVNIASTLFSYLYSIWDQPGIPQWSSQIDFMIKVQLYTHSPMYLTKCSLPTLIKRKRELTNDIDDDGDSDQDGALL